MPCVPLQPYHCCAGCCLTSIVSTLQVKKRLQCTFPALPACRVQDLPHQDNHCDCGLFVLAYLHFFTAYPPSDVDGDKKDPKAAISKFACTLWAGAQKGCWRPLEGGSCLRDIKPTTWPNLAFCLHLQVPFSCYPAVGMRPGVLNTNHHVSCMRLNSATASATHPMICRRALPEQFINI